MIRPKFKLFVCGLKDLKNFGFIFFLPWLTNLSAQASDIKLQEAYQREYIYLNTQKNNLLKAKEQTINELKSSIKELESKVVRQLAELSSLEAKTENQLAAYQTYQQLIEKSESEDRKLQALAQQTTETLKSYGYTITGSESGASKVEVLKQAFMEAESLLATTDSVQKVSMDIFDIKGKKISADVLQFGLISSMAVNHTDNGNTTSGMGLLAPAGLGHLKVVETTKPFDPLVSQPQDSQKFFIYDSINKPFEAKLEKSLNDVLNAGGLIGYVIIIFGLFGLVVAVKRFFILRKYNFDDEIKSEFIKAINAKNSTKDNSQEIAKKWEQHPALGPLYAELKYLNIKNAKIEAETLILSLDQKIMAYAPVLLGIAAVGPLLGLLGTVTGMIATFDVITEIGTGNPKMLSGGISEALVTTEFGLIVAIPCLLLGNWLNSWAKRISRNLFEIFDATTSES